MATDPQVLLSEANLDPADVESHWEPYHSLTPQFVLSRARTLLNPPASVTFKLENNVLFASGSANHSWITDARRLVRVIPGLVRFDESNLVDTNLRDVEAIKSRIENRVIRFVLDTTALAAGQQDELEALNKDLRLLVELTPSAGKQARVTIIGHTDQLGSDEKNMRLSRDRAEGVREILSEQLNESLQITTLGIGAKEPVRVEQTEADKEINRSVTVKVTLADLS
jgi:OOP family OmpA-OmpF porin